MRSIRTTLETLAPPDLAALCPRLAWVTADVTPRVEPGERVLWAGRGLVRLHGAVGAADGRPARATDEDELRLLGLAAGAGPVTVTDRRIVGVLRAEPDRPALAYELAWPEVDDVGPAASGGVRLLATGLLGGITIDPVGRGASDCLTESRV
jgi:hypothetical protein